MLLFNDDFLSPAFVFKADVLILFFLIAAIGAAVVAVVAAVGVGAVGAVGVGAAVVHVRSSCEWKFI
jgi:hypothetical protein